MSQRKNQRVIKKMLTLMEAQYPKSIGCYKSSLDLKKIKFHSNNLILYLKGQKNKNKAQS